MDTFEPPRGMRDFYPEQMLVRDQVFDAWTTAARGHGFLRYEAPVVESFELLARKAGEEVANQIYAFSDKSDRRLALRPEVTPSLVRMISARQHAILFPAKWWTIAQCFRYERMTRGRKREHYQWNVDIVGEAAVTAEAWVLSCAVSALRQLGFSATDICIRVNHRQLIADILARLGVPAERQIDAFLVLDKKGKVEDSVLLEMLGEAGVARAVGTELLAIMATPRLEDIAAAGLATENSLRDVQQLFALAERLQFADFLTFDLGIVRGLAYYTGVVFEAFDTARKFRAIFGGGRYDKLFTNLAGVDRPAVGLGFGDVVITEILTDRAGFEVPRPTIEVCLGAFEPALELEASALAGRLLAAGLKVDLASSITRPGKFFAYASKRGAAVAVFLAPDEYRLGAAAAKDLRTGDQATVPLAEMPDWLVRRLGGHGALQ